MFTVEAVTTSRAVVQHRYGAPDVLAVVDRPVPSPGEGELLVAVRASSVNARDWHIMRGEPRVARFLDAGTFTPRRPRVPVRGTDVAGVVEAVGPGVTGWRVGERVFGETVGAFAEHVTVSTRQVARIPAGVSFERAAATPLAGVTALACLDAAGLAPGQSLLVNGASGGVGTFALQLAKARGLRVTAVCSTRNLEQARRLGADETVDYTVDDFTRRGRRYDAVIDLVGNRRLRDLGRAVAPDGTVVLSGGGVPGTGRTVGPLGLLVRAQLWARVTRRRLRAPLGVPDTAALERLGRMLADDRLHPVIEATYPLERVADAVRHMETRHTTGKVVVTTA
ncbi:NAD(P)-dependent alcohol dehydrogenase [Nocardioides iriomotensis]|uniref:NAD(P)-dependent alcohol dehydrogenase n=1 Tax=Nocardioides iriomotensis TaxID=715784 RepID=A0A4Q5JAU1_9ACTN|nr:NAD(P)-dependent alcohol dehydrogenase [Nocardioides iriomotensis]RYU15079.1 NAD(P)-dependent alcohol dehydrogenase [Nocardioides iriomotensis]